MTRMPRENQHSFSFLLILLGGFNGVSINITFKITQLFDLNRSDFFLWVTILLSCGCYNRQSQTWCLKTTYIYSVIDLEARSVKPRWQQGQVPARDPSEESIHSVPPSNFWWLPAFATLLGLCLHGSVSFSPCLCASLL